MRQMTSRGTLKQIYRRLKDERAQLLAIHPDCSSHITMLIIHLMYHYFLHGAKQEQSAFLELKARPELAHLCAVFDEYQWRLDGLQGEDCIYPDVLGYVFEQQINQKQMGAYYTQRDVADYIAQRTILPYLLDAVKNMHPSLFSPTQAIWQLLSMQPERYIHPALCSTTYLATETEREYHTRRARYKKLSTMLQQGQICTVADVITYNLAIQRFVLDIIATCEQPTLLSAFYTTLTQMTILDPTCGTGAFLLAAMTVLVELYSVCFKRMQQFIDTQHQWSNDASYAECCAVFRSLLTHAPYASLLSKNLYGIDIMPEAVEVCKMQLTLALIACGDTEMPVRTDLSRPVRLSTSYEGAISHNTVQRRQMLHIYSQRTPTRGFPTIENVREAQQGIVGKPLVGVRWSPLLQWNIHAGNALMYVTWAKALPEQYSGFDVIIGNPPYVEYSKAACDVPVERGTYGNLYAEIVERSLALCRSEHSYLGLLVPLSICGGERFTVLRRTILANTSVLWLANFDIFPCRLFENAYQRLTLLLGKQSIQEPHTHETYVTHIQRWYAAERATLIERIFYTQAQYEHRGGVFPKMASTQQEDLIQKMTTISDNTTLATLTSSTRTEYAVYYQEATNTWMKATRRVPYYKKNDIVTKPPHGRLLYFDDERTASIVGALMNSSLFYVWFATYSDGFHLAHALVRDFPVPDALYTDEHLLRLAHALEDDIQRNALYSTRNTKKGDRIEIEEYRMACSKFIIDEINCVLAKQYGFTNEELDFIMQYDQKYRMGRM